MLSASDWLSQSKLTNCPGPTGPLGPSGPTGPSAPTGPTGASGVTGPTGPSAPTGPTGASGATGPSGPAFSSDYIYTESITDDPLLSTGTAYSINVGILKINQGITISGTTIFVIATSGIYQINGSFGLKCSTTVGGSITLEITKNSTGLGTFFINALIDQPNNVVSFSTPILASLSSGDNVTFKLNTTNTDLSFRHTHITINRIA
jgi:hypothetical protein